MGITEGWGGEDVRPLVTIYGGSERDVDRGDAAVCLRAPVSGRRMQREGFDSSLRLSVSAAEFGRGQQVSLVVGRGPERGAKEGDVNVVCHEGAAIKQPNGGSWISTLD